MPSCGDEDADPLYDSKRTYVEQIDRYKQHQGKLTTRKPGKRGPGRKGRATVFSNRPRINGNLLGPLEGRVSKSMGEVMP